MVEKPAVEKAPSQLAVLYKGRKKREIEKKIKKGQEKKLYKRERGW